MQDYSRVLQQPSAQEVSRQFVSGVYSRMMLAVLLSALSGFVFNATGITLMALQTLGRGYVWTVFALQMGTILVFQSSQGRLRVGVLRAAFAFYAVIMGLTISLMGYIYTLSSLVSLFSVAVLGFGALASYGSITKRDLGPVGSFCLMGAVMLFGLSMILMVGSLFPGFASVFPTLNKLAGFVGIIVFSGLTAWESQKIRQMSVSLPLGRMSQGEQSSYVLASAFSMYLNFIGLFLSLMRVFGSRK